MSYIIQNAANISKYLKGKKVFVEGLIYKRAITITPDELEEILAKLNTDIDADEARNLISRVRFESVIVITVGDESAVRAAKIEVETRQIVGNEQGISREHDRIRRNLERAVDITFEELFALDAWGVETGMLQQPGLKESLEAEGGSKVDWWMVEARSGDLVAAEKKCNNADKSLLLEIIESTMTTAAGAA